MIKMAINYEELIKNIVLPLVINPDDVVVEKFAEEEGLLSFSVKVNKADLGRVSGKNGKIANALRTIAYAGASKEGIKVNIEFDTL